MSTVGRNPRCSRWASGAGRLTSRSRRRAGSERLPLPRSGAGGRGSAGRAAAAPSPLRAAGSGGGQPRGRRRGGDRAGGVGARALRRAGRGARRRLCFDARRVGSAPHTGRPAASAARCGAARGRRGAGAAAGRASDASRIGDAPGTADHRCRARRTRARRRLRPRDRLRARGGVRGRRADRARRRGARDAGRAQGRSGRGCRRDCRASARRAAGGAGTHRPPRGARESPAGAGAAAPPRGRPLRGSLSCGLPARQAGGRMSSPLAIGAVSAVLRNLLDNGFINAAPPPLSPVKVTAVAPDTIKLDDPDEPPSLNLFLYRTSLNQGWAEVGLPVFDGPAIRRALDPSPLGGSILPPAFQALTASDLADQVEGVTITHEPMDSEEMSRLWSAIQAHYRPTASYLVSVVLIEARKPSRTPLPVLSRGPVDLTTGRDRGVVVEPSLLAPYPTILSVDPPPEQPAARLGETIRLAGHHLDGTSTVVRFAHRLLDDPNEITVGVSLDSSGIDVTLPTGPTAEQDWPAGVYTVSVVLIRPGEPDPRESNIAAMLLAPEPVLLPPPTVSRRSEEHTSELQSHHDLVCRLL